MKQKWRKQEWSTSVPDPINNFQNYMSNSQNSKVLLSSKILTGDLLDNTNNMQNYEISAGVAVESFSRWRRSFSL